jgi:hypothetical protein
LVTSDAFRNRGSPQLASAVTAEITQDINSPATGVLSTYLGVLAKYSAETGSGAFKGLAYRALNFAMYVINDDGCPRENSLETGRGGWRRMRTQIRSTTS